MALPSFVARRYLLSRRLPGAVNVITLVAMAGLALIGAALIITLSTFNGFNSLISSMYKRVDPALRVDPARGKFLPDSAGLRKRIAGADGVAKVAGVLEGRAILQHAGRQRIVKLKGVPADYQAITGIEDLMTYGRFELSSKEGRVPVVMGGGVAHHLNLMMGQSSGLTLFTLSEQQTLLEAGEQALRSRRVHPQGIFSVQKEYDDQLVYVRRSVAQNLFEVKGKLSAYELQLAAGADPERVKTALTRRLGADVRILTTAEQHATLYRILKNEKAVGYLVLVLMLVLVCVNIIGSMTMIVSAKKPDIGMLQAFGATAAMIRAIFLMNGTAAGGLGGLCGLALGAGLVLLQERYHLLKLKGGENFVIDYFPMQLNLWDVLLVGGTILLLAVLASLQPAARAARSQPVRNLQLAEQ